MSIEFINITVSGLVTIIAGFISIMLRHKYMEYQNHKLEKQLNKSELIQTILEQQLEEYNCQRAFILEYHNGGKFGTGKPMSKISTTYEAVEEGTSREFREYQNLHISLYSRFIELARKNEGIFPVSEEIPDILTRTFFLKRGVKSAVVYPIRRGNDLIALVGFEWTHTEDEITKHTDVFQSDSTTLGDTLSKLL